MYKCIYIFLCILAVQLECLHATDWYVDNVKGNDISGNGSAVNPFQTIKCALNSAKTSDAVYLTPNLQPYTESVSFPVGGTVEKQFIFDGRGAVINRLTHYTADRWTDEGAGIYSMSLPNNAHVMDKQWHGFDLVFFDGQAGKNCSSLEDVKPFGYFLFKQRQMIAGKVNPLNNILYIMLPDGKTPANVKVEAPGAGTILHCKEPYVTVRNITVMYGTQDGFSTTHARGIIFERVRGCYNMDQGISHHGSEVTVKNSRFDHNAGCGIVDVYPECRTRYVECLIEEDTYRGGVEFHSGEYEMENCIIRNNKGKALSINRSAKVKLSNCVFIAGEKKYPAILLCDGQLYMKNCTVYNASEGLSIWPCKRDISIEILNCAFINNQVHYSWKNHEKYGVAKLNFDFNSLTPSPLKAYDKVYKPEQWADFQKETELDVHSLMKNYEGALPPYKTDSAFGANMDLSKF